MIERSLDLNNSNSVEKRFSQIRGVGTIVLNSNHQVLVGMEMLAKREHGRQVGQLSIPLETLKRFERENPIALRFASLVEIVKNETVEELRQGLREVGLSGPVKLSNDGVYGALAVFHWIKNPNSMPFLPAFPSEFSNLQWREVDEVVSSENIRPYARTMLTYAQNEGLLNGLPDREIPLFNQFRPDKYSAIRDNLHEDLK